MLATAEEPVREHRVKGSATSPAELVPAPSEQCTTNQRRALELAAQALTFAGLLLAPERGEEREPRLALLLLRESFLGAARALTGIDSLDSVSEALTALETRADLPRALQGSLGLATRLELESRAPPEPAELLELEALVAELIRFARRAGRAHRERRWQVPAAVLLVAAVVGLPYLYFAPSWWAYEWRASSAYDGFPKSGTLKQRHEGLVFHTGEDNGPWVLIDMRMQRTISQLVLENRTDCCTERGLPLIAEAGNTPETLTRVGSKSDKFDEWTLTFAPQKARYVRLRAEGSTYLHLRSVAIQ